MKEKYKMMRAKILIIILMLIMITGCTKTITWENLVLCETGKYSATKNMEDIGMKSVTIEENITHCKMKAQYKNPKTIFGVTVDTISLFSCDKASMKQIQQEYNNITYDDIVVKACDIFS